MVTGKSIVIVQEVFPPGYEGFRLIETYETLEGLRTRVASGWFRTLEEAHARRDELIKRRSLAANARGP